jgi:hypothetical protein
MKNRIGPPVEGDDFFGRQKELEFAFGLIKDGNSLLLAAPRRVGKTSFAKKLLVTAEKNGWRTMELNLEGIISEQQFVRFFVQGLETMTWWKNVSSIIRNRISGLLDNIDVSLEAEGVKGSIAWKENRKKVFDDLQNLFEHNIDTLIMIDELGVLLNAYEKNGKEGIILAESLLSWFRKLGQISGSKIRWVFCSSIGIRNFTNRHSISYTINTLEPYHLKSFDRKSSMTMINELCSNYNIELPESVIDAMLDKIDWYLPYFIQLLFSKVKYLHEVDGLLIDIKIVDAAYDKLVKSQHFDTWDERLKQYHKLENNTRKILKLLSSNPDGANRKTLFNLIHDAQKEETEIEKELGTIIRMLANDGYLLQQEKGNFVFRSPLLKDYWFNKFIR